MKNISIKKSLSIVIPIILIIASFFLYSNYREEQQLSDFKIINVEELDGLLTVICEANPDVLKYQVTVTDADENVLLETSNSTNRISISDLRIAYNETVYISAVIKNDHDEKASQNIYEYTSKEPSFSEETSHIVVKNQPVTFLIDGDVQQEPYKLKVYYRDLTIYNTDIETNSVKINYDYFEGYNGRLTATIENEEGKIVNEINIYNNPVLVGNVFITSPTDNLSMTWDDLVLTYQGGENATRYLLTVYNGKKIVATLEGNNGIINIPADVISMNTTYTLTLEAMYNDYKEIAKTASVTITIKGQAETKPVTLDYNYNYLKVGTRLSLSTMTNGATIKYTTNGKDPVKYGIIYSNPIIVTEDMTLKTVAIKKNQLNSAINTYKVHVGHKTPVVYLSPSNQYGNIGVDEVGYTNEMVEMNKVADHIEQRLKEAGIIVYRNKSSDNITIWVDESNRVKSDLHFAIHSNASGNHNTKGMEIFVDDKTSPALSLATKIYKNLYAIYPNKDATTDRGVRYAQGSLGEVKESNTKMGMLIEIAYHDYPEDAKWLVEKQKEIGYNIADSIIEYFQMN